MKTRQGFVSNSSSSSFCVYGYCCALEEFKDKVKKYLLKTELIKDDKIDEHISNCLFNEGTIEGTDDLSIFSKDIEENSIYVGKEWCFINDYQTGKEFKNSIQIDINEIFGKDKKCGTYSEGWWNG